MAKKKAGEGLSLVSALADDLNKTFKDVVDQVAYLVEEGNEPPFAVKDWISTGNDILDLCISNRPFGGVPSGRIIEITGLEASGKSLLAASIVAEVQKMGGVAIYYDTENAFSQEFFEAQGIDMTRMVYVPMQNIEDVFKGIESNIVRIRELNRDVPVVIIVDSIMGASTKIEEAAEYDKDGYATQKAIIISKAMRKLTNVIGRERICMIFTNQLRYRMGVTFGDPYTTSGGKGIPFAASVRLRLKQMGKIKARIDGKERIVGIKTKAQVFKNRMGAPLKECTYDIYFNSGIDNVGSWLYAMKDHKIVKSAGKWYVFDFANKETGEVEEVKFLSKDLYKVLLEKPGLKEQMYERICDKIINVYAENAEFGIDDISIDTDFSLDGD